MSSLDEINAKLDALMYSSGFDDDGNEEKTNNPSKNLKNSVVTVNTIIKAPPHKVSYLKFTVQTHDVAFSARANLLGYGPDVYRPCDDSDSGLIEKNEYFCNKLFDYMMDNLNATWKTKYSFELTILMAYTLRIDLKIVDEESAKELISLPRGHVHLEYEIQQMALQYADTLLENLEEVQMSVLARVYHATIYCNFESLTKFVTRNAGDSSVYIHNERRQMGKEAIFTIIFHIKGFPQDFRKVIKITLNNAIVTYYDESANQCFWDGVYDYQKLNYTLQGSLYDLRKTCMRKLFHQNHWQLKFEQRKNLVEVSFCFVQQLKEPGIICVNIKNVLKSSIRVAFSFALFKCKPRIEFDKFWYMLPTDFNETPLASDCNPYEQIGKLITWLTAGESACGYPLAGSSGFGAE